MRDINLLHLLFRNLISLSMIQRFRRKIGKNDYERTESQKHKQGLGNREAVVNYVEPGLHRRNTALLPRPCAFVTDRREQQGDKKGRLVLLLFFCWETCSL